MNLSEQILNNLNRKKLCEHANVGTTEDCFNVCIRTDTCAEAPYFIYSVNDCNDFYTEICIDKAEYVYSDYSMQTLRYSQREKLIKFLQEPDDTEQRKTRWEVLLIEWNRNNPTKKIETNLKMPDYMKL